MPRSWLLAALAAAVAVGVIAVPAAPPVVAADEKPKNMKKEIEQSIEKGLEYLKKTQAQDGHWEAQGGQYPTTHDRPRRHVPSSWRAARSRRASTPTR